MKSSGIDFVIIRAGYGKNIGQEDKYFEQNYINARKADLDVGAYWYSYATSLEDAKKEAERCLSVIEGKQFSYPIYLDVEETSQFNKGRDFCNNLIKTFCTELEKRHYFTGFYMSYYYLQNYVSKDIAKKYALWIADYGEKPKYDIEYGLWQYTSEGEVAGINTKCDMNYAYIDYPSIIINGKFNGYNNVKPLETIAKEVIDGLWGNGEKRKELLTKAGYDYNKVQEIVNKLV